MELLWDYIYGEELKISPQEQPVLLTEAAFTPRGDREAVITSFFEHQQVPAYYVFTQAVLALYATGRTTGLVVDSGDGVTHAVVVYDGYQLKHATQRIDLAGRDVTDFFAETLRSENSFVLDSSADRLILKKFKEQYCYVSMDFSHD